MKLLGLTVIIYLLAGCSTPLNTLFFDPSAFLSSLKESQVNNTVQQEPIKEQPKPKVQKIEPAKNNTQDDAQINEVVENTWEIQESETWVDIVKEKEKEKEPVITGSIFEWSWDYEEIVFSDVFDEEYRQDH